MATITVAELATELGTDARTTRKFLRNITDADAQPGKGGRWQIEKREVRSLKSKFGKYAAEVEATRASREATAEDADEAPEGDFEPTADDLAAIDAE
jgi:hypothetical protein